MKYYEPLAGSYAVIKCKERYLICFNKWRKQWEVPAGRRDEGETPEECARRELHEETSQSVKKMKFRGIINVMKPNGDIKFSPVFYAELDELRANNFITRSEMVAIISRIIDLTTVKGTSSASFNDTSNSWNKDQIEAAAKAGIINGEDEGSFAKDKSSTRAEALTVLLRSIKLSPEIADLIDSLK